MKEAGIVVDYVLEFRSAAHFFFNEGGFDVQQRGSTLQRNSVKLICYFDLLWQSDFALCLFNDRRRKLRLSLLLLARLNILHNPRCRLTKAL